MTIEQVAGGQNTDMALPTVSVLLPVYNRERYIREAIESIVCQTFRAFELLIIDDGSTDSSLTILRQLERDDSRITVESRRHRGVVATRNELFHRSRGQFIAIMDADDISEPERLERQLAYLQQHPECVALGTRALFIDPDGRSIFVPKTVLTHQEIDDGNLSAIPCMRLCHPSAMIRRDALLVSGESETGKSHISKQMIRSAMLLPGVVSGRFDFKGTTDMERELRAFVQQLDVALPPAGQRLNERLGHVLDELKRRAQPALLVFDTYEAAGEAQDILVRPPIGRAADDVVVDGVVGVLRKERREQRHEGDDREQHQADDGGLVAEKAAARIEPQAAALHVARTGATNASGS